MAELTGPMQTFPGGTSAVWSTTPLPIRVGQKAQDLDGNEYLFVSFSGPVSSGEWVAIEDDNTAAGLNDDHLGRVGIVMGTGPTSNDAGWVQIYGLNIIAQVSSVSDQVSIALGLRATSVLTTPLGTIGFITQVSQESNMIHNAWITDLTPAAVGITGATDASWPSSYTTLSSSPAGYQHSGSTVGVFLNYPYMDGQNIARFQAPSD